MSAITDSSGRTIGYFPFDLVAGVDSPVFVLLITPQALTKLQGEASGNMVIKARKTGSGNAFVDIHASPIDLNSLPPGVPVSYDVKITPSAISGVVHDALSMAVTSAGGAGWLA